MEDWKIIRYWWKELIKTIKNKWFKNLLK
jgi:hypothetical protein